MNIRKGITYRPLDCYCDDDTKMLLGKLGAWGYGCLQLILNKLSLENGYYLQWDDRTQCLFALDMYERDDGKIDQCLDFCFNNNIFDKDMYEKHGILTSRGIQENYKQVTQKRIRQWHKPEYVYPELLGEEYLAMQNTETQSCDTQPSYAYAPTSCAQTQVTSPTPVSTPETQPITQQTPQPTAQPLTQSTAPAAQAIQQPATQTTLLSKATPYTLKNSTCDNQSPVNDNQIHPYNIQNNYSCLENSDYGNQNSHSADQNSHFADTNFRSADQNSTQPAQPNCTPKIPSNFQTDVILAQTDVNLSQTGDILGQNDVNLKQSEREREEESIEKRKEERRKESKGERKGNVSQTAPVRLPSETASGTLAQFLSQKLNKKLRNKNLIIDTNDVSADSLYKAIRESAFLRNSQNLDIDWLIANYDDVVSGKYRDFNRTNANPAAIHHRNYDASEVKFSNIDDFL